MAKLKISDDLKNIIKQVVLDTYYPIGKLFISINNIDPNKFLGGTWVRVPGQYLMAGDPNSNMDHKNIGTEVGSKWGKRTGSTILSNDQIPAHRHEETIQTGDGNFNPVVRNRTGGSSSLAIWPENARGGWTNVGSGDVMKTESFGGGKGHDHSLPNYPVPTIVLNVWKRTA